MKKITESGAMEKFGDGGVLVVMAVILNAVKLVLVHL